MKHKLPVLLLLLCVVVTSCQNETIQDERKQPRKVPNASIGSGRLINFGMPFTEPEELELLAENAENVIDYRVARYLATVELLAGANFSLAGDPNVEWCLTPYPKVVYNYDRTPKYYEFGYATPYDGIISTVVTYAQKETSSVIAYLFSVPLSQEYGDYDYFVGKAYPARYYGAEIPEYYYDPLVHELRSIDFEPYGKGTEEEAQKFMFDDMEYDDYCGMESDLDEEGISIDAYQDEYRQQIYDYWQQVENFFSDYSEALYLSNDELINFHNATDYQYYIDGVYEIEDESAYYIDKLIAELDYMLGYFDSYVLPEYSDPRLQATFWSGYCGPSACAWVYRGKYRSFNYNYIPILFDPQVNYFWNVCHDNFLYAYYDYNVDVFGLGKEAARNKYIARSDSADYGLAACFYRESVPVWWGEWQFPLYHGGLNRGFDSATDGQYKVKFTCKPYDWIISREEPVIIGVNCDHYLVAFGTGATRKKNGKIDDKFFAIVDNGYTTDIYNYHPYMRKHNGWNLHYGLTLKD